MSEFTRILNSFSSEDPKAAEELLPLIYEELRKLAASKMANEKSGQTLQPTALVHEAWLRLLGPEAESQSWEGRSHFFGAAAEAMRRILVDRARRKLRLKRGQGERSADLDVLPEFSMPFEIAADDVLLVDESLARFAKRDPLKAEMVKLRYFVGLNQAETARALNLSEKTVQRYWKFAKAWLCQDIERRREIMNRQEEC